MIRKFFLNISLLIVVAFLASGCAINRATANVEPTTDLSGLKSMHVTKLAPDERGINILIANKLKQMGYLATTGIETSLDAEVVVTYRDKWMWDITMYMLELTITLRDPITDFPLATGNSYHTSLTRKSPEEMVDEVLNNIFNRCVADDQKQE